MTIITQLRHKRIFALLGLSSIIVQAGCAIGNDLVRDGTLNVERIASQQVRVSYLYVRKEPDAISVRGKVSKRFSTRGPIPGHVHITVIDPAGEILSDTAVGYMRRSVKSRLAEFYVKLPIEPPVGSTLRATHHASSHGHTN